MRILKLALPVLILLAGVAAAAVLVKTRKPAPTRETSAAVPAVSVAPLTPEDYRFEIATQGTVSPRTEIALTAEVSGRVTETSPALVSGGFFARGDVLVRLESVDYESAVARAESELRSAELRLAQEEAQAEVAVREWERLGEGEPDALTSRKLHVSQAEAAVDAAAASLAQARKNLERTAVRAPFEGRVLSESVDTGQFVPLGYSLARIYAVDYVEIPLPIPHDEVPFADLPLYGDPGADAPEVVLSTRYGGVRYHWTGHIVRTEGAVDARSRVLYAVARVDAPYARTAGDRPPLAVGMFVDATITGRTVTGVYVVPRSAVLSGERVLLVDENDKLRIRNVEVVRLQGEDAVIRSGLSPGERLCLTRLEAPVDGMDVLPVPDASPAEDAPGGGL